MRGIKRGFTLIELMVVIAIMAILVVVAIPSYNEYNNNQKLAEAANNLQTVLRQAQNNAQTGTLCNPGNSPSTAKYWTIQLPFNGTSYDNTKYTLKPICEVGSQSFPSSQLSTGIIISNISLSGCNLDLSLSQMMSIQFSNVASNIIFDDLSDGCPDGTNYNLTITLSNGTNNKFVLVEKGGGIYVNQ